MTPKLVCPHNRINFEKLKWSTQFAVYFIIRFSNIRQRSNTLRILSATMEPIKHIYITYPHQTKRAVDESLISLPGLPKWDDAEATAIRSNNQSKQYPVEVPISFRTKRRSAMCFNESSKFKLQRIKACSLHSLCQLPFFREIKFICLVN